MADTLEATGLFDVVFVPVLSIFLDRAYRYDFQGTQLCPGAYDTTGATRWVSSPILHVQVSTLTES